MFRSVHSESSDNLMKEQSWTKSAEIQASFTTREILWHIGQLIQSGSGHTQPTTKLTLRGPSGHMERTVSAGIRND